MAKNLKHEAVDADAFIDLNYLHQHFITILATIAIALIGMFAVGAAADQSGIIEKLKGLQATLENPTSTLIP